MVNFGPLMSEIRWRVWDTPANFNGLRVLASLLHRRRSSEVNQTLHDVWLSSALAYCICILGCSCPLMEFCQLQNSLCVQPLHSPKLTVLLHGTPAAAVSQSLRHGTRNGITELSVRATPVFGRAAIKLGIGPHSSWPICCFSRRSLLN